MNELDIVKDYESMNIYDISLKYNISMNEAINIIHYHKIGRLKRINKIKEIINEIEI